MYRWNGRYKMNKRKSARVLNASQLCYTLQVLLILYKEWTARGKEQNKLIARNRVRWLVMLDTMLAQESLRFTKIIT